MWPYLTPSIFRVIDFFFLPFPSSSHGNWIILPTSRSSKQYLTWLNEVTCQVHSHSASTRCPTRVCKEGLRAYKVIRLPRWIWWRICGMQGGWILACVLNLHLNKVMLWKADQFCLGNLLGLWQVTLQIITTSLVTQCPSLKTMFKTGVKDTGNLMWREGSF